MKTTFSIIFIFLISNLYGQNFAPNGAVWNYTYNWSFWNMGYYKMTVIGDTLLQGKSCKIIQKRNIGHNSQFGTNYNYIDGYEYVYSDTDKVYYFRFNKFYTLYDFGATPGTTWLIACENYSDSVAKVVVDSVGIETINSINLRTLYLHTDSGDVGWDLWTPNKFIEKIGSLIWMFPVKYVTGPDYPYPLRCYYDDSIGLFKNIQISCDTLYNVSSIIKYSNYNVKIYPNPVNTISTLEWEGINNVNCTLFVYNYLGELIKTVTTNSQAIEIRKSDFTNGIYFYRLTSNREQIGIGQFEIN